MHYPGFRPKVCHCRKIGPDEFRQVRNSLRLGERFICEAIKKISNRENQLVVDQTYRPS